ncbi:hypothetical protein WJX82_000483 [Trebouxia sp. C0006]
MPASFATTTLTDPVKTTEILCAPLAVALAIASTLVTIAEMVKATGDRWWVESTTVQITRISMAKLLTSLPTNPSRTAVKE